MKSVNYEDISAKERKAIHSMNFIKTNVTSFSTILFNTITKLEV